MARPSRTRPAYTVLDDPRAARRDRAHRSVELPDADLRPHRRRRARGRQRVRGEARRGRVPVAAARRRARGRGGAPGRRAQHRHRSTAPKPAQRSPRIPASITSRSPARPSPAPRSRRRPRSTTARSRSSSAASRRRSCSTDASLDDAIPVVLNAIVQNAGQTCPRAAACWSIGSSYEALLERVGKAMTALRAGPALADLDVGPLIRKTQLQRVWDFLSEAQRRRHPDGGAGPRRRRRPADRLLPGAGPVARRAGQPSARPGGDLRPGARRHAVRERGAGHRARQRYALRPGRRGLDARRRAADEDGAQAAFRRRCSSTTTARAGASSCRSGA